MEVVGQYPCISKSSQGLLWPIFSGLESDEGGERERGGKDIRDDGVPLLNNTVKVLSLRLALIRQCSKLRIDFSLPAQDDDRQHRTL